MSKTIDANSIINKRISMWNKTKDIQRDKEFRDSVADFICRTPALLDEIKNNPELLIEMLFIVIDKNKKTVPFFLNSVQKHFLEILNKSKDEYNTGKLNNIRIVVAKGRQQGFTTLITAYQLACTLLTRNFSGFTIADCSDNTSSIFQDKAKFLYDSLPSILKPTEKYNNRKELLFDKINSSWRISTASREVGRSKTINFLHCSEAAFFDIPISDIQAAIGEALTMNAIVIYESTCNGYNQFKDLWDSKSCINLFYEWWLTPEYRTEFNDYNQKLMFSNKLKTNNEWIYQRCRWLRNDKGLTMAQVNWYYNKYSGYLNKEKIKQEYPCTIDEAWLASGLCVFDKENIIQRKDYLKNLYIEQPPKRGYFDFRWNNPDTKDGINDSSILFTENNNGYITFYKDKESSIPYVIGGDTKGEGNDRFAATVINNVTGERVATLHGDMDPDTYTHQVYCLGKYYNEALIGIEVNFDIYPIKELQRLLYPRQYTRQTFDTKSSQLQYKYGWKTDANTRPMIISSQVSLLRDNIELFNDITMLEECLTFVYDKNGRPDAENGKHDDLLFSDMIANSIRSQQTFKVSVKKELKGFFTPGELDDVGEKKLKIRKV